MSLSEGVMFKGMSSARSASRRLWSCTFLTMGVVAMVSIALAFAPGMHTSVLTIVTRLFTSGSKSSGGKAVSTAFYGLFYFLLLAGFVLLAYEARRRKTDRVRLFDGIYRAALKEEIKYRKGAEDWSWRRRLWMQSRFGAAHFWNLVIPLNVVVGLACAGLCFLAFYLELRNNWGRDESTQITAVIHARYNAVLLGILVTSAFLFIVGAVVYHLFA